MAAILLTTVALSLSDALIKRISADFALWQIFVLRSAIAVPLLIGVFKTKDRYALLKPRHLYWTTVRSVMLTSMWILYYTALPHVALSVAAAAYYTSPIFITLFAAFFVGDRIGARQWIAVVVGFIGVLLMLRPNPGSFSAYALLPILSAVLYALAMTITRTKCRDESPLVLSLGLNYSFLVVGMVATLTTNAWRPPLGMESHTFLFGSWSAMGTSEWLAITLLSGALVIGSVGAAIAYQVGRSSVVATFDFSYVPFAAVWGLLFFSEVPDLASAIGMAVVVAAGVGAIKR